MHAKTPPWKQPNQGAAAAIPAVPRVWFATALAVTDHLSRPPNIDLYIATTCNKGSNKPRARTPLHLHAVRVATSPELRQKLHTTMSRNFRISKVETSFAVGIFTAAAVSHAVRLTTPPSIESHGSPIVVAQTRIRGVSSNVRGMKSQAYRGVRYAQI
jgi:hypothetical protein